MGPVWEANHVWLIFVIVMLFTCFPGAFSPLVTALFVPLHLALLGIILRGASFVFQAYARARPTMPGERVHKAVWQTVFGAASLATPFLLGASFGAASTGHVHVGQMQESAAWLRPYAVCCGLLAVTASAYLAAVYLCAETDGGLREDFRKRAVLGGTATAALAGVTLAIAHREAHWFFARLVATTPVFAAGVAAFAASAWAVFTRRWRLARACAAAEVALLLIGWAAAQNPYVIYPGATVTGAAAPPDGVRFMVIAVAVGMVVLVPSLALLFRVFKGVGGRGEAA
jgi:cytochrome d ubiquinol oxidase subunit II